MSDLKQRFTKEIVPNLIKKLSLKNTLSVPKITKIVVNVGVPKSDNSKKNIEIITQELQQITGQEPKVTKAKKAIAGFNIRQGDPIGLSVILRGERMFDFLEKLYRIVLPQVRDFRGIKLSAFDGQGNYTLGLTEQIIFPEIDYAKVDKVHGMEITIVTSTNSDKMAKALLEEIGMPFEKEE